MGSDAHTRFNEVIMSPDVLTLIRYLVRFGGNFRSAALVERLAAVREFPKFSIRDAIDASHAAGVPLSGARVTLDELDRIPCPFLVYLERPGDPERSLELVKVEGVTRHHLLIHRDRFGERKIKRSDLLGRWTGVVLVAEHFGYEEGRDELSVYRADVQLIPGLLTSSQCAELIDYCERAAFKRSTVLTGKGPSLKNSVKLHARSSSSVMLEDRTHPILKFLYKMCAEHEQVPQSAIEDIQCVRYKRSQRFRAHFDAGIGVSRMATYLLYLNDDFEGGETYFPMLDLAISPHQGSCLRFTNTDCEGRILWASQHGGLPVQSGTKYALNIWIRRFELNPSDTDG